MSDLWSEEVAQSLHRIQFGYRADPTDKRGNPEKENARADGMFCYGGFGGYIEVKSARGMSWDMRGWRDDQREWYQKWCVPQNTPLFIWLNIEGTSRIGTKMDISKGKYPRKAWLVPANKMLEVHSEMFKLYDSHSINYHARPGINVDMQRDKFDALNVLSMYELSYLGGNTWDIRPWHLLGLCASKARQTTNRDVTYESYSKFD